MGLLTLERVAQLEPGARRYASLLEPAPGRVPFAPTDATPPGPLGRDEEASGAPISLLWQRAAVLGSLWAASEIVLGSFLHELRVPFAGHFLTAIAIVVLMAGPRGSPAPSTRNGPDRARTESDDRHAGERRVLLRESRFPGAPHDDRHPRGLSGPLRT